VSYIPDVESCLFLLTRTLPQGFIKESIRTHIGVRSVIGAWRHVLLTNQSRMMAYLFWVFTLKNMCRPTVRNV